MNDDDDRPICRIQVMIYG